MSDEPIAPGPTSPINLPNECCSHCRFFFAAQQPGQPSFCRRHPPIPFLINLQWSEDKTTIVGNTQLATNPTVHPIGWCGEFERRPEDVN